MRTYWLAMLAIVVMCTYCACSGPQAPVTQVAPRVVEPVANDGGIYYFPVFGADYRASLAAFRKANPDLRCSYFGADEEVFRQGYHNGYAHIVGHTIVCTGTATYAQEVTVP